MQYHDDRLLVDAPIPVRSMGNNNRDERLADYGQDAEGREQSMNFIRDTVWTLMFNSS